MGAGVVFEAASVSVVATLPFSEVGVDKDSFPM